jgi:hypothetical protein
MIQNDYGTKIVSTLKRLKFTGNQTLPVLQQCKVVLRIQIRWCFNT